MTRTYIVAPNPPDEREQELLHLHTRSYSSKMIYRMCYIGVCVCRPIVVYIYIQQYIETLSVFEVKWR